MADLPDRRDGAWSNDGWHFRQRFTTLGEVTAADVYRALWRHKFFIVAFPALLVGATWYFTDRQTPVYEA